MEQEALGPPFTVVAAVAVVVAMVTVVAVVMSMAVVAVVATLPPTQQAQGRKPLLPRLHLLRPLQRGLSPAWCFEGHSEEIEQSGRTCPFPGC